MKRLFQSKTVDMFLKVNFTSTSIPISSHKKFNFTNTSSIKPTISIPHCLELNFTSTIIITIPHCLEVKLYIDYYYNNSTLFGSQTLHRLLIQQFHIFWKLKFTSTIILTIPRSFEVKLLPSIFQEVHIYLKLNFTFWRQKKKKRKGRQQNLK